jgi:hypothetical protein
MIDKNSWVFPKRIGIRPESFDRINFLSKSEAAGSRTRCDGAAELD